MFRTRPKRREIGMVSLGIGRHAVIQLVAAKWCVVCSFMARVGNPVPLDRLSQDVVSAANRINRETDRTNYAVRLWLTAS